MLQQPQETDTIIIKWDGAVMGTSRFPGGQAGARLAAGVGSGSRPPRDRHRALKAKARQELGPPCRLSQSSAGALEVPAHPLAEPRVPGTQQAGRCLEEHSGGRESPGSAVLRASCLTLHRHPAAWGGSGGLKWRQKDLHCPTALPAVSLPMPPGAGWRLLHSLPPRDRPRAGLARAGGWWAPGCPHLSRTFLPSW